ncbi:MULTISPECIES: HAD family hydrolase [unclassified Treponema]|uniref:HAD family hydrolase n=1 Tax=unclassified Treponema TaxID=2638727 RepID=UPI0025FAFE1D|nr:MULTISPECIES: HAD family phosphatase [unclassified Treponema]
MFNAGGISAFVFDMDGVLLDTESLCKKCWRLAAEKWNLKGVDEVYYQCVGQSDQDTLFTLQNFFEKQNENFNVREWYDYARNLFRKTEESEGIELMPGAKNCLERLKNKGFILALASSTRRQAVERQLSRAGLIDYFETLTCGDSVEHSKPDPEIYLRACSSVGIDPKNCVAVEDSPNGVLSAYNAGLKVILVPDQIKPDEKIKSLCAKILNSLEEI